MNPYTGAGFFDFFSILFSRLFMQPLVADEIQLAVLVSSAIACGVLGPFLILKRMTMFANSLSHTSLLGVVGAFLLGSSLWGSGWADLSTLLIGALFSAILTAGLTEAVARYFKLQQDASIGLVFTTLFAIGVILVTLFTRNAHISSESVMGNPDALQLSDLKLTGSIALLNVCAIVFLYRKLLLTAFDSSFARTIGSPTALLRAILFLLTSATAIGAFRAIGVIVVLALLVGPYLTARLFCHRLTHLLFLTPTIGALCCLVSVALSRAILSYADFPLSTGGLVATVIGLVFGAACLIKNQTKKLAKI